MKKLLLAPTLLCAMSGYALAADAVVVESPPEVYVAPVFNWTGADVTAFADVGDPVGTATEAGRPS